MGKQYIASLSVSGAHKSDILGLEICRKYTVTISSDGYINLWNNDIKDLANPKESVVRKFVNNTGLHHLAVFDDIIEAQAYLIVAATAFNGNVYFYRVIDGAFHELNFSCGSNNYAIDFLKHTVKGHKFISTEPSGEAKIYKLQINGDDISLELYGKLEAKVNSFATSVKIDSDGTSIAIGYQNGDVHLFELETLKPTYSFLGTKMKSSSTTVRSVNFSPVGKLLAVARDSGSYGSITLYDVYYGETIGTLTAATHSANIGIGGYAHDGWCFTLDFNEDGTYLVSGGFDKLIRVWNVQTREREATIHISKSDFTDEVSDDDDLDDSIVTGVRFINKGLRAGLTGGDKNEGICCISFDKGVRWYREAGGI